MENQPDSVKFAFLPKVVGLVMALYLGTLLAIILFLHLSSRRDYSTKEEEDQEKGKAENKGCCAHSSKVTADFFTPMTFESTYVSFPGAMWTSKTLCFLRLIRFLFFLIVPCIMLYTRDTGDNWINFTFWNIDIIVFYYLMSFIASVIGLRKNPKACLELSAANLETVEWNYWERGLALIVQIFFNVAATTALLVTVFAFTFLTQSLSFYNMSYHFANTLSFAIEIFLSSLVIRFEYIILALSWLMLYAIYAWSMVVTHAIPDWPYVAFHTDTSASLFNYALFYILLVVFFIVWYLLSGIKVCIRGRSIRPLLHLQRSKPSRRIHVASVV